MAQGQRPEVIDQLRVRGRPQAIIERVCVGFLSVSCANQRYDDGPTGQHRVRQADGGKEAGAKRLHMPCAVIDETPSVLDEILERPGLDIIWPPDLKPLPMMEEQSKQIGCIPRIIFGPAGRERFPVLGQGAGLMGYRTRKSYCKSV